jgi:hypothetical protein
MLLGFIGVSDERRGAIEREMVDNGRRAAKSGGRAGVRKSLVLPGRARLFSC